jgi:hypothetical protein
MQTVNRVVESQILAKLTYYKYRNFAKLHCIRLVSAVRRACSKALGSGKNGKRYQFHQPPSQTLGLAGRTLSLQSNHSGSASMPASDYNNGATLIPAGLVRIHFFL